MPTLRELIDARVPVVRRPEWAGATLAFYFTADNHLGPWVTLTDPNCQTENRLLILDVLKDDRNDWVKAND